jgi:hypothetical protein
MALNWKVEHQKWQKKKIHLKYHIYLCTTVKPVISSKNTFRLSWYLYTSSQTLKPTAQTPQLKLMQALSMYFLSNQHKDEVVTTTYNSKWKHYSTDRNQQRYQKHFLLFHFLHASCNVHLLQTTNKRMNGFTEPTAHKLQSTNYKTVGHDSLVLLCITSTYTTRLTSLYKTIPVFYILRRYTSMVLLYILNLLKSNGQYIPPPIHALILSNYSFYPHSVFTGFICFSE